ncbi:helix-turn-helix domain-containing protein [Staphylococcus succinus]|uniref:helix-turn-helix domain-containing protein n=1 Tax=Staphylococcus succinus TaxID=61015 RepID=UPI000E68F8DB|nr:helix-turn-helix transcriptional regulator [Staphylococcus succinus]RIN27724.1 XRE family transcriptional regulator [Staphylococcus succinus]
MNQYNISEYIKIVSREIREERKRQRIKTYEAANNIGMKRRYYSSLETNPPKSNALLKVSLMISGLHVNLSTLLKRSYFIYKNIDNQIDLNNYVFLNLDSEKLTKEVFLEIQNERKHKGLPQRVIAEKIGIDRNYYGKIENGNRKHMSFYRIIEISEVLEVPLYVLVERAEQSLVEKAKNNDI